MGTAGLTWIAALIPLTTAAHSGRLGLGPRGLRLADRSERDTVRAGPAVSRPPRAAAAFPSLGWRPFAGGRKRSRRLEQPIRELRVQGMALQPEPDDLAQMARNEGLLGLERMPTDEQLAPLVRRVRGWYAERGYPLVGTMAALSPDGVLRVVARVPNVAREPADLIFVDANGEPAKKLGRTRARAVANALGLKAGRPFRLSSRGLDRLLGPGGPFVGMSAPQLRITDAGDAQILLAVHERNFTEVAPTLGIRGAQWYAALSASDANLRGRMQALSVELSKYNATSASLSFDDPRLGRELGFGADVWVDNVRPKMLERLPALRAVGGHLPALGRGGEAAEDEGAPPSRRRHAELERAGLTLRWDARRDAAWRLRLSVSAEKVAPRAEGGAVRMGAPGGSGAGALSDGGAPSARSPRAPSLDVPVTLVASATSQRGRGVRHRLSASRTLPLHARCPDFYALDYSVRGAFRTALPRLSARLSGEACVASSGQPEYLMRALGGVSTVRGISYGQLGLARALGAGRAELRLQVGGKRAGDSPLFLSLFADAAAGLVLPNEPERDAPREAGSGAEAATQGAAGLHEAALEPPRALRRAGGSCVGAGILVGPIRLEYTFASTRELRRTIGLDLT